MPIQKVFSGGALLSVFACAQCQCTYENRSRDNLFFFLVLAHLQDYGTVKRTFSPYSSVSTFLVVGNVVNSPDEERGYQYHIYFDKTVGEDMPNDLDMNRQRFPSSVGYKTDDD